MNTMSRAEEAALKAYPNEMVTTCARGNKFRAGPLLRRGFQDGYERAEKDIISLIESRIGEILGDAQPAPVLRAELRELIIKIKG